MDIVYICSPYKPVTENPKEELCSNILTAQAACRRALKEGYVPYASHLFFPAFLKEEIREEREAGLSAGLAMLEVASELWVVKGRISEGMKQEIARAKELGIPVKTIDMEGEN